MSRIKLLLSITCACMILTESEGRAAMYSVYKHTAPNGKVYIGCTSQRPAQRWQRGRGYMYNADFFSDILRYGWDNIQHEVICVCDNKISAHRVETALIAQYKSNDARYGYNVSIGGAGRTQVGKPVVCIDTGVVYETAKDAEKSTGANCMHIGGCCRHERRYAGGLRWAFADDYDAINAPPQPRKRYSRNGLRVLCIETGTIYVSASVAAEITGVVCSGINRACRGERKTAGGYHWKYIK